MRPDAEVRAPGRQSAARGRGWVVALLALGLLASGCRRLTPPGGREDGPAFDAARAFADLERQVEFGPRVPGTPGHDLTRDWLRTTLAPLVDSLEEDRFVAAGLELTNLVGRFRPEHPERILLCAHWDTRPHADQDPDPRKRHLPVPGANDGASGTAVLVELARQFRQRPPSIGVDLVFFDGEDYGEFEASLKSVLLGSQRFASTYRGPRPRHAILIDMIGDRELRIPREANSEACCRRTLDLIWGIAAELGHASVFVPEAGPAVLDDHVPLIRAGIGAVDLIDIDYPPWHTVSDLPEATSPRSLGVVGEVLAELVYRQEP